MGGIDRHGGSLRERQARIFENSVTLGYVQRAMRLLEARIEGLEEITANALANERKDDGVAFSDNQQERLDKRIDERIQLYVGDKSLRFNVWLVWSFLAGACSVILTYFGLKH